MIVLKNLFRSDRVVWIVIYRYGAIGEFMIIFSCIGCFEKFLNQNSGMPLFSLSEFYSLNRKGISANVYYLMGHNHSKIS